jgi:uncharacterized protein YukE
MRVHKLSLVACMLTLSLVGCNGSKETIPDPSALEDPVMSLLSKGIAQLDMNINALSKRMDDVQKASVRTDATLQELQALDLSGWQLHRQQWVLQRDHLVLARDVIQQTSTSGSKKGQLLDRWHQHRQDYAQALEELRQQRQDLERKHLEVEGRLIEHRLQ